MPHRTEVCEIITARVGLTLLPPVPAISRPNLDSGPVITDPARGLRFSTILNAIPQCRIATLQAAALLLFGRIRWLPVAPDGSRWLPIVPQNVAPGAKADYACSLLPAGDAPEARQSPLSRSPTDSHPFAPVRVSQGLAVGAACPGVATVFASNLGDSERSGLRPCQHRTPPSPTCGPRTLRSSFTSPHALCPGGVTRERALPSCAKEERFSIAATTWIPGHRRSGDLDTGIYRCGGTPLPRRTAAPMKKRRGSDTSTRALHTAHSLLREVSAYRVPHTKEVSVTPTLARRPSPRDVIPHTPAHTSHLISPGSVTK